MIRIMLAVCLAAGCGMVIAAESTAPGQDTPELSPAKSGEPTTWKAAPTLKFIFPSVIIANATRPQPPSKPDHLLGDYWGSVSVHVHTEAPNTVVVLKVDIDEIAQPTEQKFVIPDAGDYTLRPRINWRYDKLRTLVQPIPARNSVSVAINGAAPEERHGTVRVLSVNDVPTWGKASNGQLTNFSWMFAAFVNEDHPWIDQLLAEAKSTGRVKQFVGYQRGPEEVDRQVQSIYEMLHQRGITYSSITTNSTADAQMHSQHVRFLGDSVKNSQANCIDGVVLMASILRKIGLQPLIVTGPGHAILGYRVDPQSDRNKAHFVETTAVGVAPFSKALQAGSAKFNEWNSKVPHDPAFHVIDIAKERESGLMPISR